MDNIELLIDLHRRASRQGPGGAAETEKAIKLAGIVRDAPLRIADIGCGTGAATSTLAHSLNAQITAVDFLQDFLDGLAGRVQSECIEDKVTPLCASMEQLPFEQEVFDVIWSEGAIYNIGFRKGAADWRHYLKPGGLLVASEITWLTNSRPTEIEEYWMSQYAEMDTASAKIKVLEEEGYTPVGYFFLPDYCWLDNYYEPMRSGFDAFLRRNGDSEAARAIAEAERREIQLYEKYNAYYSYGFYIARKPAV